MGHKIYLKELPSYQRVTDKQRKWIGRNPCYDLGWLPTPKMQEEFAAFILYRSSCISIVGLYSERSSFRCVCNFLQSHGQDINSMMDREKETWIRQFTEWMETEGRPMAMKVTEKYYGERWKVAKEIRYLSWILEYLEPPDTRPEQEKDIWELEKLDIPYEKNPVVASRSINFTRIIQKEIREEVKKGIYLNLQQESMVCIRKEIKVMQQISKYLQERHPEICSCREFDRALLEEYLIYLNTDAPQAKNHTKDLERLHYILGSISRVCGYRNLEGIFLQRDIPTKTKTEYRAYSDSELARLNAALVELDEQVARLLLIHQMLGTRISDTLTLKPDCLYEKGTTAIIRIGQPKTKMYEKPVSDELAALIRKAIQYTKERFGETPYIFVDSRDPSRTMRKYTIRTKVLNLIHEKDLRDDSGKLFGFNTHMYRHSYGRKLTEMHLDDWTIAKLLGHSGVRNVKYYRKMSNQVLADETREARRRLSQMILENLDGWGEEYEQIRQNGQLE